MTRTGQEMIQVVCPKVITIFNMAQLPNVPLIPTERDILQLDLIGTLNVTSSFFINPTGRSVDNMKELLMTIRRLFDGRSASILRKEALGLYRALGIFTLVEKASTREELLIACADFFVSKSKIETYSTGSGTIGLGLTLL